MTFTAASLMSLQQFLCDRYYIPDVWRFCLSEGDWNFMDLHFRKAVLCIVIALASMRIPRDQSRGHLNPGLSRVFGRREGAV